MFSLQATVAAIETTSNSEEDDIETNHIDLEAGDEAKILWCINYDRFKQEFRDQVIVQAVTRRIDSSAGALIRLMLNLMNENSPWAHVSCHLRLNEILDKLEKSPNNEENMELREFHDQYFKVKWLIDNYDGSNQVRIGNFHLFDEKTSFLIRLYVLILFRDRNCDFYG